MYSVDVNANAPDKHWRPLQMVCRNFHSPRKAKDTVIDWILLRSILASGVVNSSHAAVVLRTGRMPQQYWVHCHATSELPRSRWLSGSLLLFFFFFSRYELWVTGNAWLARAAPVKTWLQNQRKKQQCSCREAGFYRGKKWQGCTRH